jgi:hypothetical protein
MTGGIMLVGEAWGEIVLSQGYIALVDAEDLERIKLFNWYANVRPSGLVHAARKEGTTTIWMHHEVLGRKPVAFRVDHKNRNGLDNRKHNLRLASSRENALNSQRSDRASLIEPHGRRFRVRVFINGKRTTIGSFATRSEAEDAVAEYKKCIT